MKIFKSLLLVTLTITSLNTFAAGISKNASASSKYSGLAVSHATVAGVQAGSAVVATPLIIVGGIGSVSMQAGNALMRNATDCTALEITDKTVTAGPSPKDTMKMDKGESL